MARALRFGFGILSYFLFFAAFVYLVGFVGNLHVPRSIDVGPAAPAALAIVINLALIALFGIQHSVMARPRFKAALIRYWPAAIERSLYVFATAVVLALLYAYWRPLPTMVWSIDAGWARAFMWSLFAAGWVVVFISTWLINHFELFGLRQIWADLRAQRVPDAAFRQPFFYKLVRHPIYTGFLLAFWAIPDMSQGHLLFAIGMTVYIFIGIHYEERDLSANFGETYQQYRKQVGMILPGVGKAR